MGSLDALGAILADAALEPAFVALALTLPGEADIAREIGRDVDPDAIFAARKHLRAAIGDTLGATLRQRYRQLIDAGPLPPGCRERRTARAAQCLPRPLAATGASKPIELALRQYQGADNMTDRMAALDILSLHDVPERAAALDDFYARYADDPLIVDKWLALQATIPEPATLDRVKALTAHPAFSFANPNRVRALIGVVRAGEPDPIQPRRRRGLRFRRRYRARARSEESAGRRAPARRFRSWRVLEAKRRALAEAALRRVAAAPSLSRDVHDIVARTLADS